jgi:hypothetical protein
MSLSNLELATLPLDTDSVPDLLLQLAELGASFLQSNNDSPSARLALLGKARELSHALETPREMKYDNLWSGVYSRMMRVLRF